MNNISIFGTSSDAGKSTITFVLAKLLQDMGYNVTPFKAQNVSNNAKVADDNSEIAVAQHFQAEVLGLKTSYHINPILLKTGQNHTSTLIVEGKSIEDIKVKEYYRQLDSLKPIVKRNFKKLDSEFDIVVAEGAGSPVELNLMQKDLSNLFIAEEFNTKIILVADISLGGVFASIYGTYNLLPKKLQKNVIGVIINKFQGDMSLFDGGVSIIEEQFGLDVLGVLPYVSFDLGFEDSVALKKVAKSKKSNPDPLVRVGVIAYPTMSNFNDFEPLMADSEVELEFIRHNTSLDAFDMIVLPGSKLTLEDLEWLKKTGLDERIKVYKGVIFGICGGFEMLCESLDGVSGLGLVDDKIEFRKQKIVKRARYELFSILIDGFELHHGVAKKYPLFYSEKNIYATFVHEVFDSDEMRKFIFSKIDKRYKGYNFKEYKKEKIGEFVLEMKSYINLDKIIQNI